MNQNKHTASKKRILVIDDEVAITDTVSKIIRTEFGWDVTCVNDPELGLQTLRESKRLFGLLGNKFDCLIVDIKMPKLTGFDLIKAWRQIEGRGCLPVIILSAYEDENKWRDATDPKHFDVCEYLQKPVLSADLKSALSEILLNQNSEGLKAQLREKSFEKFYSFKKDKSVRGAVEIQQSVLPKSLPKFPGIRFNKLFQTADVVGGDYYDFFQLTESKCLIAVVDIIGKGIPASLLMMRLREVLHRYIDNDDTPKSFAQRINSIIAADESFTRGVPMFLALLDSEKKTLSYVNTIGNAGGLLYRNGVDFFSLDEGGFMVGADPDEDYDMGTISLYKGDVALFYTDGIVEQENADNKQYGIDGVKASIQSYFTSESDNLSEHLSRDLEQFKGLCERGDDTTIITFEIE